MSGLAEILLNLGYIITGSIQICHLLQTGYLQWVRYMRHARKNIEGSDLVIFTAALSQIIQR